MSQRHSLKRFSAVRSTVNIVRAGVAIVMGACAIDSPAAPRVPAGPGTAKVAGNVDMTSRAQLVMADSINVGTMAAPVWVPAAFRGDGRLRDGSPAVSGGPSNEYQGNYCSVNAVIASGTKGEGTQLSFQLARFASIALPPNCLPTRYHRYFVNGPTQPPANASSQENIAGISSMSVGQTMVQPFHNGSIAELGYALWWDDAYPPSSSVLVTRLPNVIDQFGRSVRQWRVESRGSHKAVLVLPATSKKSGQTITSTFYYMPWAMTVTEVPYPFPTYP